MTLICKLVLNHFKISRIHKCHHTTAYQMIIPLPDPPPQTNFTAVSGDRVVLPCPIQPGALIQYYSVDWYKESSHHKRVTLTIDDSRYNIDRAIFSLIIDPVNINDTSTRYKCQVFVTNPHTDTIQQLSLTQSNHFTSLNLSLQVIRKYILCSTLIALIISAQHCQNIVQKCTCILVLMGRQKKG